MAIVINSIQHQAFGPTAEHRKELLEGTEPKFYTSTTIISPCFVFRIGTSLASGSPNYILRRIG